MALNNTLDAIDATAQVYRIVTHVDPCTQTLVHIGRIL